MPTEISAALHSIPDSIVLSHLFCTVLEAPGWWKSRSTKEKLMAYVSDKYSWIGSTYMSLHEATIPEVQHAANLIHANDTWGWIGWTLFISEANNPHMTDSYCNWIELTWREFYYLKDLIPALNRDGLPQELNP